MQRLVATSVNTVTLQEVEKPSLKAGEILAQTLVTGVCGSDIHAVQGHHPFVPVPYNPGHEVVGVVREIAPDVKGFSVGDRVTVEPDLPCWDCKNCNSGQENLCENLKFFGCGYTQGGMADFWTLPATRFHKVPESFSDEAAAMIEPLSTPVHAVKLSFIGSKDLTGKTVAILGCGTIGLLTLYAAKYFNAKTIVMTDLVEKKRNLAKQLGADLVFDAASKTLPSDIRQAVRQSIDVVYDCVAIQQTVSQAISLADKAGTVMIVGVPAKEVTVPLPIIQDHQIRIQGSATYLPADYHDSIKIISQPSFKAKEIVTAVFPKDQAQQAFNTAIAGEQIKVLIRFS
jgi:2-desacetyl-2-hydroxyethyl bacteriochlorophyllide A dehydrogenase